MVSSGDTPAFTTAVMDALLTMQEVFQAVEAHVGLSDGSLRLPEELLRHPSLSTSKEFCVGLLENPVNHPWWGVVSRLSLEHRTTVAGSLFLCRKMLPSRPSSWEDHRARVGVNDSPDLPGGYVRFARDLAARQLRGFDSVYERRVSSFAPPTSASLDVPRSKGGARSEWLGARRDFIKACLGCGSDAIRNLIPDRFSVRFANVELDGKSRSVTIAPAVQHLLGPLHRCLYDAISSKDWLLRGEAKTGKFGGFSSKPGEVFVSGDYESATDYLPLEVARAILQGARSVSTRIPDLIWDLAFESLDCLVEYPDGSRSPVVRGQLMGNLLSFPLLCLQNYTAFRWCFRGVKVPPVRINGDDIVFRAPEGLACRWMDTVSSLGLRLSRGKTLVNFSVFSLNSSFFRASRSGKVRLIPVVRSAVLARECTVPHSIASGLRTYALGFRGEARTRLEVVYLRKRHKQVTACGRSVLRDLRVPCTAESIKRLGWIKKESFFLSLPPCPLPPDFTRLGLPELPRGWARVPLSSSRSVRRRQRASQDCFRGLLTDASWVSCEPYKVLKELVWSKVISTGHHREWRWWRRAQRGLASASLSMSMPAFRAFASRLRCPVSSVWDFVPEPSVVKVWSGKSVSIPHVSFVTAVGAP